MKLEPFALTLPRSGEVFCGSSTGGDEQEGAEAGPDLMKPWPRACLEIGSWFHPCSSLQSCPFHEGLGAFQLTKDLMYTSLPITSLYTGDRPGGFLNSCSIFT